MQTVKPLYTPITAWDRSARLRIRKAIANIFIMIRRDVRKYILIGTEIEREPFTIWMATYLTRDSRIGTEYEKYIFSVNYLEQENINIHLQDNIAKMYVLCPEYTTVEVLTKSYSSATQECSLYVVDEVRNTDAVGGDLRYRIFSVDISARENIDFELCDALESKDYKIYGGFVIQFE